MGGGWWCNEESFSDHTVLYGLWHVHLLGKRNWYQLKQKEECTPQFSLILRSNFVTSRHVKLTFCPANKIQLASMSAAAAIISANDKRVISLNDCHNINNDSNNSNNNYHRSSNNNINDDLNHSSSKINNRFNFPL